jgi:hypothetical protein
MKTHQESIADARELIESLAPGGAPFAIVTPLEWDEAAWFRHAVDSGVIVFRECPDSCPRRKRYGIASPDHFLTLSGGARHLFSNPSAPVAWLNREYVPHIAAFAYALVHGHDISRASFSRYRTFGKDLITRKAGQSYETDAEFYGEDDRITLQVEAKASGHQTDSLAASIALHGSLDEIPLSTAKEIEYVLDLSPRYLWVVGPGSIDPPKYVFEVEVLGDHNACFKRVDRWQIRDW